MILGLTGTNGAGKTVAAEHLRREGFPLLLAFRCHSGRVGYARDLPPNRENLIAEGNRLRSEVRPCHPCPAASVGKEFRPLTSNYVVDSIRSPHEVRALREGGDVLPVAP